MKRREFLKSTITAAGLGLGTARAGGKDTYGELALRGGKPVRSQSFPSWPVIQENDRTGWMNVLESGKWFRGGGEVVRQFEEAYAKLLGARCCVATSSGTSALYTSLNALEVGPGDEVLVPPYTFMATVNVVFMHYALPVFVDTDVETSQMDPRRIEARITPETACILPVHLGGSPADLDSILEIGKKHKIPVLEDACQAHLAEWRQRKVSTLGDLGCFSFQASKNLNSGEGGAILTNSEELADKCYAFHNCARKRTSHSASYWRNSTNLRMTEFQARLLLEQMTRVEAQSRIRETNAAYLTQLLKEIPGLIPARQYAGCTRHAYHIYMMRYDQQHFAGLAREKFLQALRSEGVPCSGGYTPLNQEEFVKNTVLSPAYQKIYPAQRLKRYLDENHCPENDRLCKEAVWFGQTMLLGTRRDMEQIAEAIRKIQARASELVS